MRLDQDNDGDGAIEREQERRGEMKRRENEVWNKKRRNATACSENKKRNIKIRINEARSKFDRFWVILLLLSMVGN